MTEQKVDKQIEVAGELAGRMFGKAGGDTDDYYFWLVTGQLPENASDFSEDDLDRVIAEYKEYSGQA